MEYHVVRLRSGQVPFFLTERGRIHLPYKEISAKVTAPIEEIEEVGLTRFISEAPEKALPILEGQLARWYRDLKHAGCVRGGFPAQPISSFRAGHLYAALRDHVYAFRVVDEEEVGFYFTAHMAMALSAFAPSSPKGETYLTFREEFVSFLFFEPPRFGKLDPAKAFLEKEGEQVRALELAVGKSFRVRFPTPI